MSNVLRKMTTMSTSFPDPTVTLSLSEEEISIALALLLDPAVTEESKGTFLTALHQRGETAAELAGFARVLLSKAVQTGVEHSSEAPILELCGTGGDQAGLLNISTAAMFVAAGAGARVVKHGNRAVSSRCGSADVLEALGVALHLKQGSAPRILERAGCVFLLASDFHTAVAAVAPLRRSLATRGQMTIFNFLGPLLNPALPECQLAGIYAPALLEHYAKAMGLIGRRAAWAVHGECPSGGVDELSLTGCSRIVSMRRNGVMECFSIDPRDLGLPLLPSNEKLLGGDAPANANRICDLLNGVDKGAARDMVLLNAAAALHLAGQGSSLTEALDFARESIDSGRAARSLELLREVSIAEAR